MEFFTEILIFIVSCIFTFIFLKNWYYYTLNSWSSEKNKLAKVVLIILPIFSLIIVFYTLRVLASFDVRDSPFYIFYYIILGYAWIYFGCRFFFQLFDISWIDDVLYRNNKAALFSFTGGILGLIIIYSGANIGDGPGWWCVVFAGGLGAITWFILGIIINKFTDIFDRITIDRDISSGIRFGLYLLASGIILGRASGGDWTSFFMTIIEFFVGWPVLPLTALAILIERYYIKKLNSYEKEHSNHLISSILCGILYMIIAIVSVILLPPFKNSPVYSMIRFM